MSENLLSKLTSYRWLKEAISPRLSNLINSLHFEPHTILREVAGEQCSFYIGNPAGKSWYSNRKDPSIEMQFVKNELIHPGDVAIECGAHHGAASILLSRWIGDSGKVIVVEPMPDNVAILRRNIELNDLKNITLIEKAAGPNHGYISMKNRSNAAVSIKGGSRTVQVECITLDKISENLGVIPSFLKIDVEGFEYKVFEGCKSILSQMPAIFLEVHTLTLPRYGNTFDDLWKFVDPNVYDIFIQDNDIEQPVPYSPGESPGGRVHLFFRPRPKESPGALCTSGWTTAARQDRH
jgi:FkbM family methyltransferase